MEAGSGVEANAEGWDVRGVVDPPPPPHIRDAKRIVLAAVEALTDAELLRLAREIRNGQVGPLTSRERAERCRPDGEPIKPYNWSWLREHPVGCCCLPCRNKVM